MHFPELFDDESWEDAEGAAIQIEVCENQADSFCYMPFLLFRGRNVYIGFLNSFCLMPFLLSPGEIHTGFFCSFCYVFSRRTEVASILNAKILLPFLPYLRRNKFAVSLHLKYTFYPAKLGTPHKPRISEPLRSMLAIFFTYIRITYNTPRAVRVSYIYATTCRFTPLDLVDSCVE